MPRRLSRRLILVAIILLALFLLSKLSGDAIENDEEWYKHPNAYFNELTCEQDEFTMRLFGELAERMSASLDKLNITYFLCYGSLWGALKFKTSLPWDRNVDMCVIYHQLASIDEHLLYSTFKQNGLSYRYNSRRGKYIVSYKTVTGEITVFEKVGAHVERVGWEKRVFPHLYVNYQTFPYLLIDKNLPKAEFHGLKLPVPHETFEIQKYLYPDNWWNVIKPKGCL